MKLFWIQNFSFIVLSAIFLSSYNTVASDNNSEGDKDKITAAAAKMSEGQWKYPFQLPDLPYKYDAFSDVIDGQTMRIHHTKHHQGYTNGANKALEGESYNSKELVKLFGDMEKYPTSLRNSGGGFYNHTLFWTFLTPEKKAMNEELKDAIEENFSSVDNFKQKFEESAKGIFGSGWAWLIITAEGDLKITTTANQDNPLMSHHKTRGIPLLNLDVWEHAYYLKYQNERAKYVSGIWEIINWENVYDRYRQAKKLIKK
ncbi:MAG: superoxide dismutase [Bacteroidia bacterium]